MNIIKILQHDFNGASIVKQNASTQNSVDVHWKYARKKINLICDNAKERNECYRDIEEIFRK